MSNANQMSLLSELLFSDDTGKKPFSSASSLTPPVPYPPKLGALVATAQVEPTISQNITSHRSEPTDVVKRRRRNYRNLNSAVAIDVGRVQQVQGPVQEIVLTPIQLQEIERCKETLQGFGFQNLDAAYQQMTFYFRCILPRLRMENISIGSDDDLPVTDEMLHYHFNKIMSQPQQQEEVELPI